MKVCLITISGRSASGPASKMVADYLLRASRYAPCTLREVSSESKLLADLDKAAGRTRPVLVLADSSGKQLSSNELADELGRHMESGTQLLAFAIGPADGWSAALLARADLVIAFGRITLPHELAAVVAAEQIYRALTIRAGHPYHSGH